MKKLILTLLFLSCVLLAGSKAYIALFAYQTIETLKSEFQEDAAITYSWISSSLGGDVSIHDLVVTPYRLKQSYGAEKLTLSYDNLPAILVGLLDLKGGSWEGISKIELNQAQTALEGRGLINWLAQEYDPAFAVPLGIYACGPDKEFSVDDWKSIGIKELNANVTVGIESIQSTTLFDINADLKELGDLQVDVELSNTTLPYHFTNIGLNSFDLQSLSIQYVENGYFRRLSNHCSAFKKLDRNQYATEASQKWSAAMSGIGLLPGASIEQAYEDYFAYGGKIELALAPQTPFKLNEADKLLDKSVSKELGLSMSLNNKTLEQPSLYLNGEYYRPPVIVEKPIEPKAEPVIPSKSFVQTPWEELEQYYQQQIKVTLSNGKIIEGKLVSADEFSLNISQRVSGGEFEAHPKRKDITSLAIWR